MENKRAIKDFESFYTEDLKRNLKDVVFRDLFHRKEYLLKLYQAIHPEDTTVTEEDLNIVTLETLLTHQLVNDLGFTVKDKLVILIEAQSTWSVNIVVRSLMYLASTYKDYIELTKQDLYGSKVIKLPKPELYVLYTGDKRIEDKELFISKLYFGGDKDTIELKVKVLDVNKKDIINEYCTFVTVCRQQIRVYGANSKAIKEAIKICIDKDILKGYLEQQKGKVESVMSKLFDNEEYLRAVFTDREDLERQLREKDEAIKEKDEAIKAKEDSLILNLYSEHFTIDKIASLLALSVDTVQECLRRHAIIV